MLANESLIQVLEVPLREDGDYDRKNIRYSSSYPWTKDDKDRLESVINDFFNSLERAEEKKVSTSVGEVILKHEEHPTFKRSKLIQGFLKSKSPSNQLLFILSENVPNFKDKQEATRYLEILNILVKPSDEISGYSKLWLFDSILQILEKHKDKYTADESAAERLSAVVSNIRKLYAENMSSDS